MKITENRAFELVQLGNKLKEQGELGLADFVSALILYLDGFVEGVTVKVETQDPRGEDFFEAFYDVVRIEVRDEALRIPLPILYRSVGIALVKRGCIVDREEGSSRKPITKKESWMTPEEMLALVPELVEDAALCKFVWDNFVDAESAILTAREMERPDDADSIQRMVDYFKLITAE